MNDLKQILSLILLTLFFVGFLFCGEALLTIKEDDIIPFWKSMQNNNLFLKWCRGIDHDESFFYFLDKKLNRVFKVDQKTGKLANTISHPGQGPGEIQVPEDMRVKNKKVYIPLED